MPVPSFEDLDRDMQEWWDMLQARPRAPEQREQIEVVTKSYTPAKDEGDLPPPFEPTVPTLDI